MERHQSNAAGTSEVRNNIGKPRQVIAESLDGGCRTGETRITALGPVQVNNVRPWQTRLEAGEARFLETGRIVAFLQPYV